MTIADVFSEFDVLDKKGFEAHDIICALSAVEEKEKNEPEYGYEYLAFYLVPNSENNSNCNWGTFYGPHSIFTDADNNIIESPALSDITIDAVLYWEQRYKMTKNPLLTMRYAGLVWGFKNHIFHQKYESDLYRTYVDSMLKVCNEDYARHPVITTTILERLFYVAKSNEQDLILVKKAYIDFEKRHATDDSVRYWASRFLMMLEYKKYFFQEEIDAIVLEHEERLSRLCNPGEGKVNPWNIEHQATLLADYYHSIQQKEEIKRVLNCVEKAFMMISNTISGIQLSGNLENLYKMYRHYTLEDEAKRLASEIQKLGDKVKDELQPIKLEYKIPKEVFEQAEKLFGTGASTDIERLNNFACYFIPNTTKGKEDLEMLIKKHPLMFMITNKMLDYKGRPMSIVGPYESDPDGHLILFITQSMEINSFFINMAIQMMIKNETITEAIIMNNLIKLSPIFEENRYSIINKALESFFKNDYTLFCHLIIPQIENAICNLVSLSGHSVLKSQSKGRGFQLKTLDELLRDPSLAYAITEDGAYYLRLVLTDQRALNIRNLLCHGIVPPESFGVNAANRLLHVLIILGFIRFEKNISFNEINVVENNKEVKFD